MPTINLTALIPKTPTETDVIDNTQLREELQEFDLMDLYSPFNNNHLTLSILTSTDDPSKFQLYV